MGKARKTSRRLSPDGARGNWHCVTPARSRTLPKNSTVSRALERPGEITWVLGRGPERGYDAAGNTVRRKLLEWVNHGKGTREQQVPCQTMPPSIAVECGSRHCNLPSHRWGQFRILNPVPDWWHAFSMRGTDHPACRPDQIFPYLEDFLQDLAREASPLPRRLSGIWQETAPEGIPWQFEASAFELAGHRFVCIERLRSASEDRHTILQRGRESQLRYESVLETTTTFANRITACQGGGRKPQSRQKSLPGQHEPRNSHATAWHLGNGPNWPSTQTRFAPNRMPCWPHISRRRSC